LKTNHNFIKTLGIAVILLAISTSKTVCAQAVETRIGKLNFEHGVPTKKTSADLFDELDFQRACQAYLWAIPAVSIYQTVANGEFSAGSRDGDVVILEGYRNVSAVLTANVTTPYITCSVDLARTGPMVVDVPAGLIAGSVIDVWQRPLTDLGVTGPDQGKGGKYIFVGPGQEIPETNGSSVLRSPTFVIVIFYRVLDPDPVKAEAIKKGVRIYSWSRRENPPATRFLTPDPDKITQTSLMPHGMDYWERLTQVIRHEPMEDRDRFFMAMLRPLGIEKDKPFKPDERQKKILTEAAFVGEAMAKANDFDKRFKDSRYRPDSHWDYVIVADPAQDLADYSQLDERAAYFYEGICLTNAMISRTPGVGQAYLGAYRDKEGLAFAAGRIIGCTCRQTHLPGVLVDHSL
jgi:hypothetical protein